MNEYQEFELPNDNEKLSTRFILDSIRKKTFSSPLEKTLELQEATKVDNFSEKSIDEIMPEEHRGGQNRLLEMKDGQEIDESSQICGTKAPLPGANEVFDEETKNLAPLSLPPGKKFFRVSEVASLIGVESHVLRYWQSEFSHVRPFKSGNGHWVYSRKDVENLHLIRHLLHVEKFSIRGAKQKLKERKQGSKTVPIEEHNKSLETLKLISVELKELIQIARSDPGY